MKPGDIVFINGRGIIPRIIRFFDRGKFSHVAIAVSNSHVLESEWYMKSKIRRMKYEDYEIIDLLLTDDERLKVVSMASKYIGKKYDYLQIIWYIAKRFIGIKGKNKLNSSGKLICSELVSRLLFDLGIIPEIDYLYDLTPNQLYIFLRSVSKNRATL